MKYLEDATDKKYPKGYITTPLANLWVDCLPSYLTHAEWHNLPYGSIATNARVKVRFIGSRTSFEAGSTLTGFANTEHVPIGVIATNLNNSTNGQNMTYTANATAPMIPTQTEACTTATINSKLYNDIPCTAMGVPRSAYGYWNYYQNTSETVDHILMGT